MKKVRIICGTYGYRTEEGHIVPAKAGAVISVTDEEAKRIVERKVGVIVAQETVATPPVGADGEGKGNDTPGGETGDSAPQTGHLDPEQLATMTNAQLTQLGVDLGIEASELKGKNKAQLIEAITAVEVAVPSEEDGADGEGEDDDEEPPETGVEDIVV